MIRDRLLFYRKEIDKVDKEIVLAYKKRMDIVKKISLYKKENNIKPADKKRETQIYQNISKAVKDKNDKKTLYKIYKIILGESKRKQKDKRSK